MARWPRPTYNLFAGRELTVNDEVYQSEAKTNQHNRGIAWLLIVEVVRRSLKLIEGRLGRHLQ